MTKLSHLACAALLYVAAMSAQESALAVDTSRSRVEFTLGDVLHTVHGRFTMKRGTLWFDAATGKASGEIVVDASSGVSGNSARDRRMHKDVLESARYPEITFRPDRVEGRLAPQGISGARIRGVLSIHGADHDITAPAQVDAADGQYKVSAHFDVPYTKWGMKNPSTLFLRVSDRVDIAVEMVFRPAAEASQRQ